MKQLTFLRHAKSDWADEALMDIDRPLNKRGYHDAYEGSELFLAQQTVPDMMYVSTATRALSTGMIFARQLLLDIKQIQLLPWYYQTNTKHILQFVQSQHDSLQHLMFVGHNPVSTDICNALVKSGGLDELPTCGLVRIIFNCSEWKKVEFGGGEISYYQFPKMPKKT